MAFFKVGGIGGNPLRECVDPRSIRLDPDRPFAMGWVGKCNSMHFFRHERPSECHLLVTKETLDSLNPTTATYHQVEVSDGTETILTQRWRLDQVEAIGQVESGDQVFYISMKDVRFSRDFVETTHTSVVTFTWEEYQSKGWPVDDTSAGWSNVIGWYYQAIPSILRANSTSTPSLPFTPASIPKNIRCDGESSWECVCRILAACGMVGLYDPVAGTYSFAAYDGTQSGLAALYTQYESKLIWDAMCPTSLNTANAPEWVRVHFRPSRRVTGQQNAGLGTAFGESYRLSTGYSGTATNSEYGLVDTCRVQYSHDGTTIVNATDLNNRVTDLLRTIKGKARASSSKTMKVYEGVCSFKCGEEVTHVVYKSDYRYGITTTVEQYEPFEIKLPRVVHEAPDLCRIAYARATSTISGRSGGALGSGTARILNSALTSQNATEYEISVYNIFCDSFATDDYIMIGQDYLDKTWAVLHPNAITDLRLSGSDYQYKKGCAWYTWLTGGGGTGVTPLPPP